MKVLMVSCLMAVIVQIQATGYEAKSYPSYPSAAYYPAHSADKSRQEQSGEPYSFGYHIKDDPSYNVFGQDEKSDGKRVSGSYYVQLPDGRHQTVNYKDDGYGYVADVTYGDVKYPSAPSYTKYKRQVKYNDDVPSYPSTLFYPTTPYYRPSPSYPARYNDVPSYPAQYKDVPSYPKNY
ncbi:adhesive plaque matrix protein-like isoform X1 [Daphnia carinata]|uniref:adhesive plaque matrix protein-like isoform X1 n=1 Tax=Daphnia carinata TaxID=120202 RepID=UPI00258031BD|nr:adhesive plaque matrix protein-like isoform X1 [Daphnia carinata]